MNRKNEEKVTMQVTLAEILYYFSFGIMFAAKGVGLDYGHKLFTLCICISLLCLAGKLWLTGHTPKEWLLILLMISLGAGIYFSSGEIAALAALLVIAGMKKVHLKRLFLVCLIIWSVTFSLSAVLGLLHIRDGVVVVHQKLGLGPIIRWSLGYTHPNVLHVSYFVLASLLLYVCNFHGVRLFRVTTALFIGNLLVFLFSISYTGVLLMTGYLALNLYLDFHRDLSRAEQMLLQCILPFCIIFPLAGPFLTSGKVFDFFNKLLSTRFELVKNFFTHFTPTLFGTRAHFNTTAHLTLDSSFAYLLMYYGIIAFILFAAGYFLIIRKFIRQKMNKELAMMIGIVVAGVTEQFLFNLSFKNLSFFFLGAYLFESVLKGKEGTSFWNRVLVLPFGRDRSFQLPDLSGYFKRTAEISRKCRKAMTAAAFGAAGLCAVLCFFSAKMPDSVYVNRGLTEYRNEEEEVTLDLTEVPDTFHSLVIGYEGDEVGMYRFSGNIIMLERIRNAVGAGVLAAFIIWLCFGGYAMLAAFQKKPPLFADGRSE